MSRPGVFIETKRYTAGDFFFQDVSGGFSANLPIIDKSPHSKADPAVMAITMLIGIDAVAIKTNNIVAKKMNVVIAAGPQRRLLGPPRGVAYSHPN